METLTLENICPHVPYEVKIKHGNDIYTITGITKDKIIFKGGFVDLQDSRGKLILRPLNLTKSIVVDGKEITPIVELAKTAYPDHSWMLNFEGFAKAEGWKRFGFLNSNFLLFDRLLNNSNSNNQLSLFQWLYKHKFDVFGLIEKGLAIDADTLPVNPYNS